MTDSTENSVRRKQSHRLRAFWRERVQERWRDYHWFVIGGLWLVALGLGYVGRDHVVAKDQLQRLGQAIHAVTLICGGREIEQLVRVAGRIAAARQELISHRHRFGKSTRGKTKGEAASQGHELAP